MYNWSLPDATFPSGLKGLGAALGKPWLLYVPFWCPKNIYADQFRWVHSENPDHPELVFAEPHPDDAAAFYGMLFDYGLRNGMGGFEHDYLDYNYLSMPYLRKNFGAAQKWFAAIDAAALQRGIPVQMCMALPSDLMASVAFGSVTNFRASTDYGIKDEVLPLQPRDDNLNIGASSLLGFALGLRPSKDVLWTTRPENCRGTTAAELAACGGKGAHSNPGSNIELNAIVATLSTGPVSLADKARETNVTIVRRCVRMDGRILQPDKPATAVDSMLAQPAWQSSGRAPPPGMVWASSTVLSGVAWHHVLSIDVRSPWSLHGDDLYPTIPTTGVGAGRGSGAAVATDGWVVHPWFTAHRPTPCTHGSSALSSGCVVAHARSAAEVPPLHNTRPVMAQNDTHVFDLLALAPVVHGWVLLGEVGAYVRVSRDRFERVDFSPSGIEATVVGSEGETVEVTALQPKAGTAAADWVVLVQRVTFPREGGKAVVTFGSDSSSSPCASDYDCNMAGRCTTHGTCTCDHGWTGDRCERINFGKAWACSHGGLCLEGEGGFTSTWGGEAVRGDDGKWHVFAAGFAGNRTLSSWLTYSRVIHGVGDEPYGPYRFSDVSLGARPASWDGLTQHNPAALRAPDGTYLLWYMGSNQSSSADAGAGVDCAVDPTAQSVCMQRVGLATASSPYGPWARREHPILEPGPPGAWDDLFTTNPTPHVFKNGSVLLLYKARSLEDQSQMRTGVAFAKSWRGPYKKRGAGPVSVPGDCEDAGLYYSESMGVFRMVLHCGCSYQSLWSVDGIDWERTAAPQPWCHVSYVDGGNETLLRRERPKWVVDATGRPTHLLTGVFPATSHGGASFTMVAEVLP